MQEIIKVVATTNIWQNFGEVKEYPMWRSQGSAEYIIGYCKELPTHQEVGEMITELQHLLEGKVTDNVIEIFYLKLHSTYFVFQFIPQTKP